MQVYLGSIIMHINLYFVQIKAIFTVFKNVIIYTIQNSEINVFLEFTSHYSKKRIKIIYN